MQKYDARTEDFDEITLLGKPALFTTGRIDRGTVPSGYHLYEVRHSVHLLRKCALRAAAFLPLLDDDCQGDAVQIAQNIVVNHWGSIITRDEIVLPNDGCLDIGPEDLNYGTGDCRSLDDYMAKYPMVQGGVGNA